MYEGFVCENKVSVLLLQIFKNLALLQYLM